MDQGQNTNSLIMHKQLILSIGNKLPVSSQEFKTFKRMITLDRRDKDGNSSSAEDLLEVWQTQGHMSVGDYDELIVLLKSANLHEIVKIVKPQASAIQQQQKIENQALKVSMSQPSTSSYQSIAMDTGFNNKWTKIFKVVQNSDACRYWKTLGRSLRLSNSDINAIEHDNPLQLKEQCFEMLNQWTQVFGAAASPEVLIDALRSENFNKTAEDVMDCLE
ncbi:uncharacterized protein LOC135475819 [Liolophura sinensis]|uniref:uncharacterized protein LOC135475819 n=1 Tax=Liolophura sinensis TaxID=3198878 RepID=UPI0031582C51